MPNGKFHLLLFCIYVFIYCFCHFCCSLKASVISWFICYALGMQWLAKHVPDLQSQAGRAEQVTDTQYATGYWRSCGCRGLESSGREESVARGALGIRLGTHISLCSWPWEWAKEVLFLGESDVFQPQVPRLRSRARQPCEEESVQVCCNVNSFHRRNSLCLQHGRSRLCLVPCCGCPGFDHNVAEFSVQTPALWDLYPELFGIADLWLVCSVLRIQPWI